MPCFSILTQDAEKSIKHIHPRMPVIVPLSRAEEWISADTDFHEFIYSISVPLEARPAERANYLDFQTFAKDWL